MTGAVEIETISGNVRNSKPVDSMSKENVQYENAMDSTGFGKYNYGILFLCQLTFLGMIMETLGFSFVLPAGQCDLNLDTMTKGWIATIPFLTIIASCNFWGWFADEYGRKKSILISTLGGSILSIISSFMPELISFAMMRVLAGLFISGCTSIVYTFLGETSPAAYRDKVLALGNTGLTVGSGLVPLVAWGILPLDFTYPINFLGYDYRPWRLLIACFAIPYLVSGIIVLNVPESPKFLNSKGRKAETLEVLRKIYSINTGRKPTDFLVSSLASDNSDSEDTKNKKSQNIITSMFQLFRREYIAGTLMFFFVQFTVFGSLNGFYIWMPDIINKVVTTDLPQDMCTIINSITQTGNSNATIIEEPFCDDTLKTETFTYTISFAFIAVVVGILSAFLLRFVSKAIQMPVILAIIGTTSLIINFISIPILSLILIMCYQFLGTCVGLGNAFVVEAYPTNIRATAVSIVQMMGRLGSVVFTNVIGVLFNTSCPTNFYLTAGLLYVSAVFACCFPKPGKQEKSLQKSENGSNKFDDTPKC